MPNHQEAHAPATLNFEGTTIELPVERPTLGHTALDVSTLGQQGLSVFDPGYADTAAYRSAITFVATVVPWLINAASDRSCSRVMPSSLAPDSSALKNPIEKSSGVDGTFAIVTAPSSSKIVQSVKVPPISTAIRIGRSEAGLGNDFPTAGMVAARHTPDAIGDFV